MKNINVMYSHKSDDWKTPSVLYNAFMDNGFIDCFKFQSDYDEFLVNYKFEKLFINPPFSKMEEVTNWIYCQSIMNQHICLLIPARTDTKYFHKLMDLRPIVIFITGRLHYNDSKPAPFPTILLHFRSDCKFAYPLCLSLDALIDYISRI